MYETINKGVKGSSPIAKAPAIPANGDRHASQGETRWIRHPESVASKHMHRSRLEVAESLKAVEVAKVKSNKNQHRGSINNMSFVPQETDPLLANPNRPSKTQNPPRPVDPNDSQAHIDASSELDSDDEAMGTWGTRDERSTWRQRIDYFALACILVGAVLFVGAVWYIVLGAQMKDGNLGMSLLAC